MELNSEALVTARESRGFSQADVATAVGINQGLMSKAEHGLLNLKKEHVQEIAEFLNYPMELFTNQDGFERRQARAFTT